MAEIDPLDWKKLTQEQLLKLWGRETRPDQTKQLKTIRKDYIDKAPERAEVFLRTTPLPTALQQIPPMAKDILSHIDFPEPDEQYITSKGNPRTFAHAKPGENIVQMALFIAKEAGLLREELELPLRRVWYQFIKATLERGLAGYVYGKGKDSIGKNRKPEDSDYTKGLSDIIKNTNLWYSDFGIKNPSATAIVKTPKFFPPILIGLEKRSYYDVLKQMSELLGFSIYSAGGQSKFSEQEIIAKDISQQIFDEHPEYKDLDIYVISDFDPAGIDIALQIGEHQNFYQQRFGRDVNTTRLAPLPKHYKRIELEQGLYNVEKADRAGWNLPQHVAQRKFVDDEGEWQIDRERGLEVESMPDQPLEDVLTNPPTDWIRRDYDDPNGNWKSLSRMRFILFDRLIDEYGLDQAFKVLLENSKLSGSNYAGRFVSVPDEIDEITDSVREMDDPVYKLYTDLNEWISEYTKRGKRRVEVQIDKWVNEVIEQYTDKEHKDYKKDEAEKLVESIKNGLYYAISQNNSYFSINFPESFNITKIKDVDGNFYPKNFEITIPEEVADNIHVIENFSKCITLNAQEAVDYLEKLYNTLYFKEKSILDVDWTEFEDFDGDVFQFPSVRACMIDDDGDAYFIEGEEVVGDAEAFRLAEMRKKEIEKLKEELKYLKQAAETFEAMEEDFAGEAKVIKGYKIELESAKATIEKLEKELEEREEITDLESECEVKLKRCMIFTSSYKERILTKQNKIRELRKIVKEGAKDITDIQKITMDKDIEKLQEEIRVEQEKLAECQKELVVCKAEKVSLGVKYTQLKKVVDKIPPMLKQKIVRKAKKPSVEQVAYVRQTRLSTDPFGIWKNYEYLQERLDAYQVVFENKTQSQQNAASKYMEEITDEISLFTKGKRNIHTKDALMKKVNRINRSMKKIASEVVPSQFNYREWTWFNNPANKSKIIDNLDSIYTEYIKKETQVDRKILQENNLNELSDIIDEFFAEGITERKKRILHNDYNKLMNELKNMYLYRF